MSTEIRSEARSLMKLALPLAAAQAGSQLMGLVDVAVLGRYGAVELAASGLGNAIFFALSVIGLGLIMGIDPMIAQAVGAGKPDRARMIAWQGAWLSIPITIVLMLLMLVGAALLPRLGVEDELIGPSRTYLILRSLSLFPFLAYYVVRAWLQAVDITRPLVTAVIVANVVNLVSDILLVFGGAGLPVWTGPLRAIPEMGIAGAGLTTVVSALVQLAIVVRGARIPREPEGARRLRRDEIATAMKVGVPVSLQMTAEVGVFAFVGILAARLGTIDLATHQVVIQLAAFTYTVAFGIAMAASVRVGAAIGAADHALTRLAGRLSFILGGGVMGVMAVFFATAPGPLARLMTNQPAILVPATALLVVAAWFQLSDGIQAVGAGALRGAGDTKFTFYANVVGHWMIGMPIAFWLGFRQGMGIHGLWWGLCAGLTVVAVVLFVRFEWLSRVRIDPIEGLREVR